MALPLTVDTLDTIPEPMRAAYVEHDGKYRLDLDGYEDPAGLKSALQKERDAAKTAQRTTKAWADLGKTPEEIRELLAAQAKAEEDKATKGGEWDKLKAQIQQAHQAELAKKDDRIGKLSKAVERRLVDADATAAIAAARGVPQLLLPHVRASVRVIEEEDGEFLVRVVDAAGNPRVNGKGEFLTIADLVSEMRQSDVFGRAFEATGTSGGGASQSNGAGGKTMTQAQFNAMRPAARAQAMASGVRLID